MFEIFGVGNFGVGHASMSVDGSSTYISFWPSPKSSIVSNAYTHQFTADKRMENRPPDWTSAPIKGLDEAAIVRWWATVGRPAPLACTLTDPTGDAEPALPQNTYNLFTNECATTVVKGLRYGASAEIKRKIDHWIFLHAAARPFEPFYGVINDGVPWTSVTPQNVRSLVESVFGGK
jgi:hypothetical protein